MLALSGPVMNQALRFTGKYLYENSQSKVFAVTSGDLDKDNKKDILFTEPDRALLQWLKNEGAGQFTLHQVDTFPAIGIQIIDFNGDGEMDILACSYDLNMVVLFQNDGNENFTMDTISISVQHPLVLSAGDIDEDGDLDIAVATQDAGTGAMLLINNGNMNFSVRQLDTQSYSSTWVEMVDLDKDGDLDVVATDFIGTGGLIWYEQTSQLNFNRHFISYANAHGAAVGDLDGDSDLDLAAASCGSSIAWFENDGSNNFTMHPLFAGYNCAVSISICDIDQDSINDIATVVWSSSLVDWWKNDGNQVFTRHTICDTLTHPSDLCISDVSNDGFPDILTGSYAKKLAWFENKGEYVATEKLLGKDPFIMVNDDQNRQVVIQWDAQAKGTKRIELYNLKGNSLLLVSSPSPDETVYIKLPSSGLFLLKIQVNGEQYFRKVTIP